MADSENSPACALRNAQIEVKTFLYELQTLLAALTHGVKALVSNAGAETVKLELQVLQSFIDQAIGAFDGYQLSIDTLLAWPDGPAAD